VPPDDGFCFGVNIVFECFGLTRTPFALTIARTYGKKLSGLHSIKFFLPAYVRKLARRTKYTI
jgi:hypothetical protein